MNATWYRLTLLVWVGLGLPLFAGSVAAQTEQSHAPPDTAEQAEAAKSAEATRLDAARRFDRALRLFDTGDNAGALAEFKHIYELMQEPAVLYNIGLVYAAMSRPVESVDALDAAIASHRLTDEQAKRAEHTLADQRARIGRLMLVSVPERARIEVDGVETARTPLTKPIAIAEGAHVIGVVAEGYVPARKEVLIAGNADARLHFELLPIQGKQVANLIVRGSHTGADVIVDDQVVGTTPLAASVTVAAGHHRVELRRPGYLPARREIELGEGATGEIALALTIDHAALAQDGATLVLDVNEAPFEVTIDGERQGIYSAPLRIPKGAHHLLISAAGFISAEREVNVLQNQPNPVRVMLEPTPETRRVYRNSALFHRNWGWIGVVTGAVVAGTGTTLALIESAKRSDAESDLSALNGKYDRSEPPCDYKAAYKAEGGDDSICKQSINDAVSRMDSAKTARTVGYVGLGVGAALVATGVILLVTGGPLDKYEKPQAATGWRRDVRLDVAAGPGEVGTSLRLEF